MTGEPILYGWVKHFLPETLHIFLFTIGCLVLLLFIIARTWRGTLLPLLAGLSSAIWRSAWRACWASIWTRW